MRNAQALSRISTGKLTGLSTFLSTCTITSKALALVDELLPQIDEEVVTGELVSLLVNWDASVGVGGSASENSMTARITNGPVDS
jgi:hypothetical protein